MSLEQLEQSVLQLSLADRRRFLNWLSEHEDELAGTSDTTTDEAWKQETRRRIAEIERGEVRAVPGDEAAAKIRQIVGR